MTITLNLLNFLRILQAAFISTVFILLIAEFFSYVKKYFTDTRWEIEKGTASTIYKQYRCFDNKLLNKEIYQNYEPISQCYPLTAVEVYQKRSK